MTSNNIRALVYMTENSGRAIPNVEIAEALGITNAAVSGAMFRLRKQYPTRLIRRQSGVYEWTTGEPPEALRRPTRYGPVTVSYREPRPIAIVGSAAVAADPEPEPVPEPAPIPEPVEEPEPVSERLMRVLQRGEGGREIVQDEETGQVYRLTPIK